MIQISLKSYFYSYLTTTYLYLSEMLLVIFLISS